MPRSGSELLQALLAQHPDIYASATSPLLEFWYGAMSNYNLPEVKSQNPIAMKKAFNEFCKFSGKGYYESLTERPVVVDKSRGWIEYAEFLWNVYPDAKIICMTRDVEAIVKSLEAIYRINPMHPDCRNLPKTPQLRHNYWVSSGSLPLGLSIERIKSRKAKGADSRIKYVDYSELCGNPIKIMNSIFDHLEVAPYKIDPNNIIKSVEEDDSHYGVFGNHKLKSKI